MYTYAETLNSQLEIMYIESPTRSFSTYLPGLLPYAS